jgi:hypothetical protein
MRMTVIAIVVTIKIVGEHRNAACECARGRENRSRRQKFGFHFFDAPEVNVFTIRNVLNTTGDRSVSV